MMSAIRYISKIYNDYVSSLTYDSLCLAHRGAFSRDDPEGGARCGVLRRRLVTAPREVRDTARRALYDPAARSSLHGLRRKCCRRKRGPRPKIATVEQFVQCCAFLCINFWLATHCNYAIILLRAAWRCMPARSALWDIFGIQRPSECPGRAPPSSKHQPLAASCRCATSRTPFRFRPASTSAIAATKAPAHGLPTPEGDGTKLYPRRPDARATSTRERKRGGRVDQTGLREERAD